MKRLWMGALCAALFIAACGGSDSPDGETSRSSPEESATEPTENVVEVGVREYMFDMPDTITGGVVTFDAVNDGAMPHEMAFGRIEGDHDIDDVLKAIRSESEPPWLEDVAGVGLLGAGANVSMTRDLNEGRYIFLCYLPTPQGKPHVSEGMVKVFDAEGTSEAEFPEPDFTITANAKGFDLPETVEAGTHVVELVNADKKGHEFQMLSPEKGKTVKDVGKWFGNNLKGEAPALFPGGFQSIEPGTEIFLELEFEAGRTYMVEDFEAGYSAEIKVE